LTCTTEEGVCTAFMDQWAAIGEKCDEERYGQFENSQDKVSIAVFV